MVESSAILILFFQEDPLVLNEEGALLSVGGEGGGCVGSVGPSHSPQYPVYPGYVCMQLATLSAVFYARKYANS